MIISDADVLSESLRPTPPATVEAWLVLLNRACALFAALGEPERRCGEVILTAKRPRNAIGAVVAAERNVAYCSASKFDCQIAAIARAHSTSVSTRDTGGYDGCSVAVINPWDEPKGR
jgi:predicted nucleic acid-binding protein